MFAKQTSLQTDKSIIGHFSKVNRRVCRLCGSCNILYTKTLIYVYMKAAGPGQNALNVHADLNLRRAHILFHVKFHIIYNIHI